MQRLIYLLVFQFCHPDSVSQLSKRSLIDSSRKPERDGGTIHTFSGDTLLSPVQYVRSIQPVLTHMGVDGDKNTQQVSYEIEKSGNLFFFSQS